ncbi:MAG: EcsC family protein [Firmicutes bacterium]|nr:EcsC family protein [Bacillota bacterium]
MTETLKPTVPRPILDKRERDELRRLDNRYKRLTQPNGIIKAGNKALEKLPDGIKGTVANAKESISEKELVKQALKYAATGFQTLEEIAASATISEKTVIKNVNKTLTTGKIDCLDEVCYARSYEISRMVSNYKRLHIFSALAEGAGTGAFGFVGIVPNLVLSTFLYFRAVQSVAMYYGYDVKNDSNELEIASGVFMSALTPAKDLANNELTAAIGKFMVFSETTAVKQTAKKTWTAMAEHEGLALLITQIRALSNVAAKKALETAGKKGLEESVFRSILEQLGKQMTLKATGRAMPVIGGAFGALFDTAQMKKIINYADIFYNKRFIEEKEIRINYLLDPESVGKIEDVIVID